MYRKRINRNKTSNRYLCVYIKMDRKKGQIEIKCQNSIRRK